MNPVLYLYTKSETAFFYYSFSYAAIHQEAPAFADMSVQQEILETGIKVVDLLAPYARGGKIGMCVKCRCFCFWYDFLQNVLSAANIK